MRQIEREREREKTPCEESALLWKIGTARPLSSLLLSHKKKGKKKKENHPYSAHMKECVAVEYQRQ